MTPGPSLAPAMRFEPVIGLEIHAQLLTATKIFCGCSTAFGAPPNTHVCPVCLGLPGRAAGAQRPRGRVRRAGGARARLHACTPRSVFARKNYFYPDLPKGYQISQYDEPLATGGRVEWDGPAARVSRGHHARPPGRGRGQVAARRACRTRRDHTHVDFNRSGVPLIEIVTEPDLRSADEAAEFFTRLRAILVGHRRQRRQHGGGQPPLRRQRVGAARSAQTTLGHEDRGEEPQLVPLPAEGARVRDRAPDRGARGRRARRAGDAAVGRGRGPHGRRCAARKTRTTTATSRSPTCRRCELDPGVDRAAARGAARTARGAARSASSPSTACPPTTPAG